MAEPCCSSRRWRPTPIRTASCCDEPRVARVSRAMKTGDAITPFGAELGSSALVAYGAPRGWHRMHYDESFAKESGLGSPVSTGKMSSALGRRSSTTSASRVRARALVPLPVDGARRRDRALRGGGSARQDDVRTAHRVFVGDRLSLTETPPFVSISTKRRAQHRPGQYGSSPRARGGRLGWSDGNSRSAHLPRSRRRISSSYRA